MAKSVILENVEKIVKNCQNYENICEHNLVLGYTLKFSERIVQTLHD